MPVPGAGNGCSRYTGIVPTSVRNTTMERLANECNRISFAIDKVVANILGVIVLVMFASLFAQVISRYCFGNPLSWPEEVTMFLMAWMSFLGASVALRQWGHIGIDFILARISGKKRISLLLLIRVIAIFFTGFLAIHGTIFVFESTNMVSDGLRINMVYPRLSMPIGGMLMTFHIIAFILDDIVQLNKYRHSHAS